MVSVEPLPKQGCEMEYLIQILIVLGVSVEPLPKQGCESPKRRCKKPVVSSQWNPCRSRGASRIVGCVDLRPGRLSGTPAEAGVRVGNTVDKRTETAQSQWNPCRSRGARRTARSLYKDREVSVEPLPKQGCERTLSTASQQMTSLSGTPAEAGVREVISDDKMGNLWRLSGTPAEAGVRAG